ncbi:LuxR C-terminal-related transcriptional regulator [Enterobacter dykesii]|uniref:LuxR C-terminal-related transcriptional regulator n=1 Tax=Enterobacter dykesii TaxID=2797506 RepID=UPI0032B49D66
MLLSDITYACSFSRIAFTSILQMIEAERHENKEFADFPIIFIDGDRANRYEIIQKLYMHRKANSNVYIVTLCDNEDDISSSIKHLSDIVVSKKILFQQLENQIRILGTAKPKALGDSVFGDIVGELLESTSKEQRVIHLLLQGYSQTQVAKMLHLSVKTVSGYKVKAAKRHGFRNFNELFIHRCERNTL